jgi:alpha-galactosidase
VGKDDTTTLTITMEDELTGLEVDLVYVCMHNYDAITRRAVFRNTTTDKNISISRAHSFTVDFESTTSAFHLVQLSGSWARERMVVESKVKHGVQSFGSIRGVSSHQHNPFAVLTMGPPREEEGETRGFALIYSGNFLFEVELDDMGRLRVNMGIHPHGFGWNLNPGSEFNTPEAVLVRSSKGLGGMSRALHRLILDRLIMPNWSDADSHAPPILLNSWEAKYFNVNHTGIVDMARQARRIGADLLVLDDGWFGNRSDDQSSLGDWVPNLIKFPHGLDGLAREVNAIGIKFGIWVEPEMVSESSSLYRTHPDWCLHVPGRSRGIGRYQLVLDLSRADVRDHLFAQLSALLDSANIEYVKWDMNRPLTEVFSQRPRVNVQEGDQHNVWQAETTHRFVLGVYELQSRVTTAFPHVLLENCASGGGIVEKPGTH